jgi:peptide chain release factor 2
LARRGARFDLDAKEQRKVQVERELEQPQVWADRAKAEALGRELGALTRSLAAWTRVKNDAELVGELLAVASTEKEHAEAEELLGSAEAAFAVLEVDRLFSGDYDGAPALLSIHAGAGGTDAQDWAEMLARMYVRLAESMGWKSEVLDETRGTEAGIKSLTMRVVGEHAYGWLKTEAGVHRLVRQSPFNADALRQTSFALIDVVPELTDDVDGVELKPEELRIDTFMSGGKGGQSVNTTYSAVRIVHVPTGITVQCQNERSQLQNKATAMSMLRGRLLQRRLEERAKELAAVRGEVAKAEWGSQIRSYVLHPYRMVKDHRTEHETANTQAVLDGDVRPFMEARLRQLAQASPSI